MITKRELYDIRRSDPDGGTVEPTDEDYEAFRTWVVAMYGEDAYRIYTQGNWDSGQDV